MQETTTKPDARHFIDTLSELKLKMKLTGNNMQSAWREYIPHTCDPVKMGRDIETLNDDTGYTLAHLRVRQREALITFDSAYWRFITFCLDMNDMFNQLRITLAQAMLHWKSMDNRSPDRWLKDALAAEIVDAGNLMHDTTMRRPDTHDSCRPLRGMEEAAGNALLGAFDALNAWLTPQQNPHTCNIMLGHSLVNTYPTDDACPAVTGGFEGKYPDLRKVFLMPPRHIPQDSCPALFALSARCHALQAKLEQVREKEKACADARGSVNEGPHGLRLVQALQSGVMEDNNTAAIEVQKPRRLAYEQSRAALLLAIAAAEDQRRALREQLVAALKETNDRLDKQHRRINGSFDNEIATRRAVSLCLYTDSILRTVGKALVHAFGIYQTDITSRWAAESVAMEMTAMGKLLRVDI